MDGWRRSRGWSFSAQLNILDEDRNGLRCTWIDIPTIAIYNYTCRVSVVNCSRTCWPACDHEILRMPNVLWRLVPLPNSNNVYFYIAVQSVPYFPATYATAQLLLAITWLIPDWVLDKFFFEMSILVRNSLVVQGNGGSWSIYITRLRT